jgi:hypothetical protein
LFKVYTSQPAVVFLFSPPQILPLRQIRKTRAGRITPLELWPLALVECVEEPAVPASSPDRICVEERKRCDAWPRKRRR